MENDNNWHDETDDDDKNGTKKLIVIDDRDSSEFNKNDIKIKINYDN